MTFLWGTVAEPFCGAADLLGDPIAVALREVFHALVLGPHLEITPLIWDGRGKISHPP